MGSDSLLVPKDAITPSPPVASGVQAVEKPRFTKSASEPKKRVKRQLSLQATRQQFNQFRPELAQATVPNR